MELIADDAFGLLTKLFSGIEHTKLRIIAEPPRSQETAPRKGESRDGPPRSGVDRVLRARAGLPGG